MVEIMPNPPSSILVRPRLYIHENLSIGPGKIDLLKSIALTNSIAAAARNLGMPYKRAWLLISSLNQGFGRPVIETVAGGKGGGKTQITALGMQLISAYEALEVALNLNAEHELQVILDLSNAQHIVE